MHSTLAFLLSLVAASSASSDAFTVDVLDIILSNSSEEGRDWVGVNMDFWPSSKDKWNSSGALVLDLTSTSLNVLAKGLNGSILRLGGSPADYLLYETPGTPDACSPENLNKTQPASKSGYFCPIWDQAPGQCLTLSRWEALLTFAQRAGLSLVLDLNACWGRANPKGDIDWSQIDGLLAATSSNRATWGSALWGIEFGNELYENVEASLYGESMLRLRGELDTLFPPPGPSPRVLGPDCWENDLSPTYYHAMLNASRQQGGGAPNAMHAVTFHEYADDCCTPFQGNALNITCLDNLFQSPSWVRDIAKEYGVSTWNGEGALHAYSGVGGLTNTALSTLFYLHALASYADLGFGLFSRQTLVGGDYELVNRTTLLPTPDYWGLLLWKSLVKGGRTLNTTSTGGGAGGGGGGGGTSGIRAHALCSDRQGGVVVLLVNFAVAQGVNAQVQWPTALPLPGSAGAGMGMLYQLTGVEGWEGEAGEEEGMGVAAAPVAALNEGSQQASSTLFRVALNNATLSMVGGGAALPSITGVEVGLQDAVWLPPLSATFVVWQGAGASACM